MKILIVGFGASGQRFAETLRGMNIPNLELWVFSRSREMKFIQTDLQILRTGDPLAHYECNFLDDFSKISTLGLNYAIIATTPDSHFEYGKNLLASGIPCMIEKPLALMTHDVTELVSLAEKLNLALHVCYQSKFHPMLDVIKNYSSVEHIGSPHFANFNYRELISSMQPFRESLTNHELNEKLSGGVAFSLSHEIYFLTQILNSQSNFSGIRRNIIEDSTGDATSQINTIFDAQISNTTFPCFLNLDLLTWPPNRQGAIHGSKGSLSWDWVEQTVTLESTETGIEFWDFSKTTRNELQELQLNYFMNLVCSPYKPNEDNYTWLRVTEIATLLSELPLRGN
jgi:predicted dehydrogenase